MNMAGIDSKQQAILTSAWAAFSAYGFRKTSMDDIAKGAGVSRPALYLHFKNKEAIFRALVQVYYGAALADVRAALAGEGTLVERLEAAFAAQGGEAMEAMLSSPHGLELFEAGMSVAAEEISAGEEGLRDIYARWLEDEACEGRAVLSSSAEEIAAAFCAAMKGVKHTASGFPAYRSGVRQLARLFGAGLTPK
ncbi:TetR/AcrR family transcriptional regulator [Cribrihabitans neustonicus]|uniref:TetR/AcrR family transcriptional regulator n=1 Tax=Cribrihabitans neustonicus TaxID=1429085 RepID=UPI003B5939A3